MPDCEQKEQIAADTAQCRRDIALDSARFRRQLRRVRKERDLPIKSPTDSTGISADSAEDIMGDGQFDGWLVV